MKELYSFDVKREVEKEVPHVRKTKNGPVETTKKVKSSIKTRVVVAKPSVADVEDAEFFYGQKYNEFINAGFLTKAMLAKKMGDLGGMTSKRTEDIIGELVVENSDAARVIEFFGEAKELSEEQKKQLEDAKVAFASTQTQIRDYETSLRGQFSQTADSKAEQKLIEWFILNFTFFEESLKEDDKKELFPFFKGENYVEKRSYLLRLQEKDDDVEDVQFLKKQKLFEKSYQTLVRVLSVWYNNYGNDQKSIDAALKEVFEDEQD
jgi:hypothetical protein|tara:strand:+ start:663 stop:1454 length:792 start_codon:yes stop_codon:yes gene_type:complete